MKRLHSSRDSIKELKKLSLSTFEFTEDEVISLSTTFLSSGYHRIKADSLEKGRLLVTTLLESLHYYHNPAIITIEPMQSNVMNNVYYDLLTQGIINELQFTEYLCNNFYYDFLCIEETPQLHASSWFRKFERDLINLRLDMVMPIVVLHY